MSFLLLCNTIITCKKVKKIDLTEIITYPQMRMVSDALHEKVQYICIKTTAPMSLT